MRYSLLNALWAVAHVVVAAVVIALLVIVHCSCASPEPAYRSGRWTSPENDVELPTPVLLFSDLPAEMRGPPAGTPSVACHGVFMQCENHGTTTRCWCSDVRIIR